MCGVPSNLNLVVLESTNMARQTLECLKYDDYFY